MAVYSQTQSLAFAARSRQRELTGIWITAREAFLIAIEALRAHKLRSFLTLLGLVIATTTLIVVMSVINGMNLYIADHIANLGANVFIVHQFQWAQGYEAWLKARRRNQPVRIEDYNFLKENVTGYKNIGAEAWRRMDVRYKSCPLDSVTGSRPRSSMPARSCSRSRMNTPYSLRCPRRTVVTTLPSYASSTAAAMSAGSRP